MKLKTILTLSSLLLAGMAFGQSKTKVQVWENAGEQYNYNADYSKKESITYTARLKGNDSVSVSINTDNCGCLFYITYEGVKKPSKGLKRQYLMTDFWNWEKSYTIKGKDTINKTAPKWVNNMGTFSFVQGVYTLNGKFIQPKYIITKHGKYKVN